MAEAFLGEIKICSFNFPPKGWALCNGQFLPINQNQALFSCSARRTGGMAKQPLRCRTLQARTPVHFGAGVSLGESAGTDAVTLTQAELPPHGHLRATSNQATSATPVGNVLANAPRRGVGVFAEPASPIVMTGAQPQGGGQPHDNRQPSLVLNFVICLIGIFPSRD